MLSISGHRASCPRCSLRQQIRHATLIRRPKRPYTFTQLITLSDGSTFTHRTTSPQPVYRNVKDTKNSVLWNPSSQKLLNVEEDEAGKLRRFRARFGGGYDVETMADGEEPREGEEGVGPQESSESLLDLISGYDYGQDADAKVQATGSRKKKKKASGDGEGSKEGQ